MKSVGKVAVEAAQNGFSANEVLLIIVSLLLTIVGFFFMQVYKKLEKGNDLLHQIHVELKKVIVRVDQHDKDIKRSENNSDKKDLQLLHIQHELNDIRNKIHSHIEGE